jgi:hypothetical protein
MSDPVDRQEPVSTLLSKRLRWSGIPLPASKQPMTRQDETSVTYPTTKPRL